ncbi:Dihydrolipoyllysine-residue succinyltransferase component of 2-oxoglutarate dehydrogenase complex [Buchnera aphidicola (Pterocallis alni)]|uniref:dihydrolipoyllysine-residue succinyltransferase n=1 Tax=Buchnera aphidicola TaxID=9 RepID=UPI003464A188
MNQINILIPELPESIHQATIINWHKQVGEIITQDEILLDIETEKVVLEIPASINGVLKEILYPVGSIVTGKQIVGYIQKTKHIVQNKIYPKIIPSNNIKKNNYINNNNEKYTFSPSARRMYSNKDTDFLTDTNNIIDNISNNCNDNHKKKKENIIKVPMSHIRKKIAEKLLNTRNKTAMLTTFNEVNMQSIIHIKNKYSQIFQEIHHIKLGFMSFIIKAVLESLKIFPILHAQIDKDNIIYNKSFDINIAVSTKKGLITPVIKKVDKMSMADIEKKIKYFIEKGNEGKLELSDLVGGNFTITNGGVFGSLLSTPMINFPQSAILGMHAIKDRVIAIEKKIKIVPMMYLALSYDHRLIDGKEAIGFLNKIKNILEDFSRILLNI